MRGREGGREGGRERWTDRWTEGGGSEHMIHEQGWSQHMMHRQAEVLHEREGLQVIVMVGAAYLKRWKPEAPGSRRSPA